MSCSLSRKIRHPSSQTRPFSLGPDTFISLIFHCLAYIFSRPSDFPNHTLLWKIRKFYFFWAENCIQKSKARHILSLLDIFLARIVLLTFFKASKIFLTTVYTSLWKIRKFFCFELKTVFRNRKLSIFFPFWISFWVEFFLDRKFMNLLGEAARCCFCDRVRPRILV